MRHLAATLAAAAAIATLTACGGEQEPETFDSTGMVYLPVTNVSYSGLNCGKFKSTDEVRVKNGNDELIAAVALGKPEIEESEAAVAAKVPLKNCTYRFTLSGLPSGEKLYVVAFGDEGSQTYTEEKIRDGVSYRR
ncbi:hypothetical protein RCF19_13950 [Rhodococcus qingshengii]